MRVDPLFVDLRIALDNAEPLRKILIDHLAETDAPLPMRRPAVLSAASLAAMNQLRAFRHVVRRWRQTSMHCSGT